jgi:hypothetical protein
MFLTYMPGISDILEVSARKYLDDYQNFLASRRVVRTLFDAVERRALTRPFPGRAANCGVQIAGLAGASVLSATREKSDADSSVNC